jgi:hypothetical protein
MALLATIALALVLLTVTVALPPATAWADGRQAPPWAAAGDSRFSRTTQGSASAGRTQVAPSLPRRGNASNPYDMETLRNFDAGSHRLKQQSNR